jgi:hypothetical protein
LPHFSWFIDISSVPQLQLLLVADLVALRHTICIALVSWFLPIFAFMVFPLVTSTSCKFLLLCSLLCSRGCLCALLHHSMISVEAFGLRSFVFLDPLFLARTCLAVSLIRCTTTGLSTFLPWNVLETACNMYFLCYTCFILSIHLRHHH